MSVRPEYRESFARHAAVVAIKAELDRAYAASAAAQRDIKWLTELLVARAGAEERARLVGGPTCLFPEENGDDG